MYGSRANAAAMWMNQPQAPANYQTPPGDPTHTGKLLGYIIFTHRLLQAVVTNRRQ
jgi:hypothetical protein